MRLGFTNKERYGFGVTPGYGFAGGLGNVCVTQGTDGTWYGAKIGVYPNWEYGEIAPSVNIEGEPVYSFRWNASGDFIMEFGENGDTPVTDVNIVVVKYNGTTIALTWDPDVGVLGYTGNNLELATLLINNYVLGEDVCFDVTIIPQLFISYDFDLLRGTKV